MLSYAGQPSFGSQNAAPWQQTQPSMQLNPGLGLPPLSGPGAALANAQHATMLNSNASAFHPALTQQASGSQAPVSLDRDRSTLPETVPALGNGATINTAKPAAALSPVLEQTDYTMEEGEIDDEDDVESD